MRASRAILLVLSATLAAGCAAHDGGATGRGRAYEVADRSADGWRRREGVSPTKLSQTRKKGEATPAAPKPAPIPTPAVRKKGGSGIDENPMSPKAKPSSRPLETRVAMLTPEPLPQGLGELRTRVVGESRRILDGTAAKPPRQDCSGFVVAAYARAGHPLEIPEKHTAGTKSVAEMLYRWARADGRTHNAKPQPGDLAFFRDTFGKIDGRITHIAIVESVDADGDVKLLHNIGGRYRRSPMNLADPHEPLRNGFFRKRGSANEPVLAGELFVAYARVK